MKPAHLNAHQLHLALHAAIAEREGNTHFAQALREELRMDLANQPQSPIRSH